MASIVYTLLLIVSFILLMWKNDDTESYFPLKIIGYFILGSLAFNFNQISLPLGFVVYLLLFRPKLNVQVKRIAAVFGILAFTFVHWIIPYSIEEWKSQPIFIEHELGSVYTINFQDEYELVKQKLQQENNKLRLGDFEVDYTKDGRITDLNWQLIGQKDDGFDLYQVRYEVGKGRYRILRSQPDIWLQYDRLIDANQFFKSLNVLDIKDITHAKGDFSSYGIQSSGERINYGVENQTNYVVSNGEIQLLDDELLPVECYYISTFAIKKRGEERDDHGNITQESFEGTELSDYLFDVNFDE